jgi:hypothetical protein
MKPLCDLNALTQEIEQSKSGGQQDGGAAPGFGVADKPGQRESDGYIHGKTPLDVHGLKSHNRLTTDHGASSVHGHDGR